MKYQAIFSSKDKSKKMKVSSAAIFVWRFKGKSNTFETWMPLFYYQIFLKHRRHCLIIKYFRDTDIVVV